MRAAGPADAQAVAELIARCDASYGEWAPEDWSAPPPDEPLARERLGDPSAWSRVAFHGERAVGIVVWWPIAGGALLSWLFTDPGEWGSGLAQELHDDAIAAMRTAGHAEAELWVHDENGRARRFYERNGWRPTGEDRVHDRLGLRLLRYSVVP